MEGRPERSGILLPPQEVERFPQRIPEPWTPPSVYQKKIWFVTHRSFMRMGTARIHVIQPVSRAVPHRGRAGLAQVEHLHSSLRRPCLHRRRGTFHAAGCRPLRPGTAHACRDRIPVPDGVERPRPRRHVPGRTGCPRPSHASAHTPCAPPRRHQHEGPVAVGLSTNHNRPRARTSTGPQPQPSDVRTPRRPPRRARSC